MKYAAEPWRHAEVAGEQRPQGGPCCLWFTSRALSASSAPPRPLRFDLVCTPQRNHGIAASGSRPKVFSVLCTSASAAVRPLLQYLLPAVLTAMLVACGVNDDITDPGANAALVDLRDGAFHPDTVRVAPGRAVRWTNRGQQTHDVTSTEFGSGSLSPGWWFERVFEAAGTVSVYCSLHANETGTVVVAAQ